MKNILFYGSRILAAVVLIGLLSMIGVGNPKALPLFILFFLTVFAVVFLLNRQAQQSQRSAKSNPRLMQILQIIGLVVFIAVFSLLGLNHGIVGYLIWVVVIALVCGLIYSLTRKRQRHSELVSSNPLLARWGGIVSAILAVLLPVLLLRFGGFIPVANGKSLITIALALVGVLAYIALVALILFLINKWGAKSQNRVLGYLLLLFTACVPGVVMLLVNKESYSFAGIYMTALLTAILTYFALDRTNKLS